MSDKLLSCPFCGGAVHLDDASNFLGDTMWTPFCDSDDCGFMLFDRYPTQEEAITAWNTRPVSQAVVSQDLVPVGFMYESVDGHPQVFTERMFGHRRGNTETPLYPASAIEAAQIAAVKAALAYVEELAHDHRVIEACLIQAIKPSDIITALRTPSQQGTHPGTNAGRG